jgi:hypothetical protein
VPCCVTCLCGVPKVGTQTSVAEPRVRGSVTQQLRLRWQFEALPINGNLGGCLVIECGSGGLVIGIGVV